MLKRYLTIIILIICLPFLVSSGARCQNQEAQDFPFGVVASPAEDRAFGRDPEATIRYLKDLGVKWVRIHWAWKEIESGKGDVSKADLARYDDVIDRLKRENFEVVLLLGGVPTWSGERPRLKKNRMAKGYVPAEENLRHIVDFLVGYYKGKVGYYQILNETTLPSHWTEPEEFARLMEVAYRAAKSKDPTCKIIMGGFGTRGMIPNANYLERFIKAGGAGYIDVLDFHMYNYISRIYRDIPKLKEVLEKCKVEKPIWILETGDPSDFTNNNAALKGIARHEDYQPQGPWDWPTFDEEEQARRLVKRMVLARSQGVEKIFWYNLQDRIPKERVNPRAKKSGHKNTKGLLYADFTPKKSFYAYKFLISKLAGARFEKALDLGHPNCLGFLFTQGTASVAVAWCWQGSAEVDLALGAKEAQVHDKLGKALGVLKGDRVGKIRATLTPDPLYLTLSP
jgi:hypothetical protein